MEFADKTLICSDCNNEFIFTGGEQAFYAERGFENEPKRCKSCRDRKKTSRSGGGGRERSMVSVVCDSCGATTQVPFTPVNGRPVFCRDCYSRRKSSY